jgi:hypothetical protein
MARRIAIIDHNEHELLIEDINEQELEEKYGGDEQKYIDNNYDLENYSWDWITDTQYYPEDYSDPIEIDFEDLI